MTASSFRSFAECWLVSLLLVSTALAQSVTGSITGVVTDPSGALIVGANITAVNTGTSVATSAQTNASGAYTIRFLPVGTYTLTIEASGFAAHKVSPFALEINQTVKIDASLSIGATTTVVVQEEIHPILDTTDSSLGNTLSANEIANIPLNGRNFSSLTLYQPGAINTDPTGLTGNNAIERNTYNSGQVAINGNRQQENNYMIEGADNNEPQNNLIGYNPAPDAIAELRVISANADATYGNANGGAIIAILKSGTNTFHGSLYDLLENENFDANSWGNEHSSPIIPKNSYTQNIFGGTFGGPIIKNKLFFFGDYEGVRRHTGGNASASLLTPAMLQGDFSQILTATNIQLYDTQSNFAAYKNNQIPVVNPVAKFLSAHPNLYPAPNAAPTDKLIQNNFQGAQSSFVSNNQEDFKVDWTLNDKTKVNGFYAQGTGSDFTTALVPVFFPAHNTYPTKIIGASWLQNFSPTLVNEARVGFSRVRWNNGVPSDPSGFFGDSGNQKVGIPFGSQRYAGFSGQSINNNASYIGANANPQVFTDNTFNYYDNLSWQRGRHQLTMGVQAIRYQQNYLNASNVGFLGQFTYSGSYSENLNATNGPGYGPADFVLDRISNVQLASPTGWVGNRQWRLAGYFQDDFKITPKLTLNLGLRYEYDQPWYEQNDKTANVLPNGTVEYAGHVPAGAVPGSTVCPTRACYDPTYNQLMPRIGFAYQMMNKVVVRGGYGATSFFEGYSFNQRLTSSPPFSLALNNTASAPTKTTGGVPFTVEQGFGGQFGINPSYNLYSVWPQNTQPAYIHQYNLTTEYALTNELSLSLGYHGQNGFHLADYRDGNQLTLAQAPGVAAILNANSGNCGVPFPAALQTPYYSLVGECGPILVTESEARMNYNSGQVTLRQRTHHGLEYTLNYTWAKSLTDSSGNYAVSNTSFNGSSVQNAYDLHADWGPSGMDIRHSMNFVGVYELPFGRGRTYGGNANALLDAALGGWKFATSAILYSGFPVTIFGTSSSGVMNAYGFSRANQYRPMIITNRSINDWWGTDASADNSLTCPSNGACAYGVPASFTFGSAHNSTERAPGYRQVDTSFFKDFHVWGEHVMGFRADLFNAFNIASYGNPDNGVTDSNFGQISSVRSPPRQIQLSLHYSF